MLAGLAQYALTLRYLGNAGKHRASALTVSLEEGTDDADDQRRLEAFAQTDEKRADENAEYALHALDSRPQLGTFEFAGDELRVCMAAPGDPRPEEFLSAPGDGRAFTVWKRP